MENFRFVGNSALLSLHATIEFTGKWQNVGNGTVDNPQGEFVFTSAELMRYYDGSIYADTWVLQPTIRVYVNEKRVRFDVQPIIVDNRTLVPIRFIAEALGAGVDLNDDTREVTLSLDGESLTFVIGELAVGMDVPAQIINNRTFLPLRFISEFFGAEVEWCDQTRTVTISIN